MHETDGEREHRSQQKDADDRVAELIGQQFPYRIVLRRQYDKAKEYIDKMLNEKIDDQSCEAVN